MYGDAVRLNGYRGADKHDWYGVLKVIGVCNVMGHGRMYRVLNPGTNRSNLFLEKELERAET